MGLSSTLIYTSELILCFTICVPSATRHNIHKLHLGLNILIKLNEILIDVYMVFFRLHGPFEVSFYKIIITFSRRSLREESPFSS